MYKNVVKSERVVFLRHASGQTDTQTR